MKIVKIISLKKGDFIIDNPKNFMEKKGEVGFGIVDKFKVTFSNAVLMDLDSEEIDERRDDCAITFENGEEMIAKLDKKDIIEFEKLKLKIKMIKELK